MTVSNLDNAIERLKKSRHYKDLRDYKPPFNPFEVMGVTDKEILHSRVLAWLLQDRVNKKFRYKLLNWVADQFGDDDETKCRITDTLNYNLDDIDVKLEDEDSDSGRIDIFARFQSFVIGIEVKVWANEGTNQILRYQELLEKRMLRDDKSVLIFLTRLGYKSTTYDKDSKVSVVCMSWRNIVEIIDEVNDASEKIGEEYIFRKQFSQHIKRNILMEKDEKVIVRNLLNDPSDAETVQKIINNVPSLDEYWGGWKQIVANVCDADKSSLEEIPYHQASQLKELKLTIPKWKKAGLPFTLMLYRDKDVAMKYLAIRILLQSAYLNPSNEEIYIKLKKLEDESNGIVKYEKLVGWGHWYSVLSSDRGRSEVPGTYFISEDWEEEAKKILEKQLLEEKNANGKNLLQLIQDNLN